MSTLAISFVVAIGFVVIVPAAMLLGDARYDRSRLRALEAAAGADVG